MLYQNINGVILPAKSVYYGLIPIRTVYWGANRIFPNGLGWMNCHGKTLHPMQQYEMGSIASGSPWYVPLCNYYTSNILVGSLDSGNSGWFVSSNSFYMRNDTGSDKNVRILIGGKTWTTNTSSSTYRVITTASTPTLGVLSTITGSPFYTSTDSASPKIIDISTSSITVPAGHYLYPFTVVTGTGSGQWYASDTIEDLVIQVIDASW